MVTLYDLFYFMFDPILWSIPFVVLLVLCLYKMVTCGADSRFDFGFSRMDIGTGVKVYGTLNVFMFAILGVVSLCVYTVLALDRFMAIYLCFCVLFAAYGISELYARIFLFNIFVKNFGLIPVLKGMMYPTFFAINHVPLYIYLQNYCVWKFAFDTFLLLQFIHLLLYVVHGYKARIIKHLDTVIKSYYYVGRALAISSYIILLVGFIT